MKSARDGSRFLVVVDETGDVLARGNGDHYGYGFVGVLGDALVDVVRTNARMAFPGGFHLSQIRRHNAKVARATRLVDCVPPRAAVFGGAFLSKTSDYTQDKFFDGISGRDGNSHTPSEAVVAAVREAPTDAGKLLNPSDIFPGLWRRRRLIHLYTRALRTPIVAGMMQTDPHTKVSFRILLGAVGDTNDTAGMLQEMGSGLQASLIAYEKAGLIHGQPRDVEIDFTGNGEPLLWFADLFAGIAHHIHRRGTDSGSLGMRLHRCASHILSQTSELEIRSQVAPGIVFG